MDELNKMANIAEIIGVFLVVGGFVFAIIQLRQFRQQRRELAAIELFRFFGNPDFTQAYMQVLRMQDDMTAEDVRASDANLEAAAVLISATMENIGVMTYQRIVPFIVVYNLMGGSTPILWRRLRNWVMDLRREQASEEAFEWFQWLAERLEDCSSIDPEPAYVTYRDWMPSHLQKQIGA